MITEDPSSATTAGQLAPLADFGALDYTAAKANGTSMSSQNPVKITMVDVSGADKDTTSAITNTGAFHNIWKKAS